MDLSDYDRRKFEIAELLRAIRSLFTKSDGACDQELRDLFAKLAEDRFNLVVVGRFSRGKSTLMNAIMGMDRLPTGIAPLTSVITAVGYGSEEAVELAFEGRKLKSKIGLNELAHYVTQDGNPGNVRRVQLAEIQLPSEILRRGFYFVDTPGLGSAVAENTETTAAFLPQADAFLLVTGYESPLSGDEFQFLRETAGSGRRVFIAVNKQDTVAEAEREQALAYVETQLRRIFETGVPKVFSTSAVQALAAKQTHDDAMLQASGVPALEAELIGFLINEKSRQFLLRLFDRAAGLLRAAPASTGSERIAAKLGDMRRELSQRDLNLEAAAVGGLAPAQSEKAGACEICMATDRRCVEFISHYQYELTVSADSRKQLAAAGGLCRLHSWWYSNITSPQGVCIAYPEFVEDWARRLSELAADPAIDAPSAAAKIELHLGDQATCRVCRVCDEAEAAALTRVAALLESDPDAAVRDLSAICLHHLPPLLRAVHSESARRRLLEREAGLAERIAEDMRRYALKFDGLRRALLSEAEEQASTRAMRLAAGVRNLSYAKKID